jgi:hypothetical protein
MSDRALPEGCTHERGRPTGRPVPDQRWKCPDCGHRVGYSNGAVLTVDEMNDLAREQVPRYVRFYQRLLREGLPPGAATYRRAVRRQRMPDQVQRFTIQDEGRNCLEHPRGRFMRYSDYEKLEEEEDLWLSSANLRAKNAEAERDQARKQERQRVREAIEEKAHEAEAAAALARDDSDFDLASFYGAKAEAFRAALNTLEDPDARK